MTGLMDEAHLNYYRQFGHTVAVWSAKLVIADLLGHIDALTERLSDVTAEREKYAVAADVAAAYDCYASLPPGASDQSRRAVTTVLDGAYDEWKASR